MSSTGRPSLSASTSTGPSSPPSRGALLRAARRVGLRPVVVVLGEEEGLLVLEVLRGGGGGGWVAGRVGWRGRDGGCGGRLLLDRVALAERGEGAEALGVLAVPLLRPQPQRVASPGGRTSRRARGAPSAARPRGTASRPRRAACSLRKWRMNASSSCIDVGGFSPSAPSAAASAPSAAAAPSSPSFGGAVDFSPLRSNSGRT